MKEHLVIGAGEVGSALAAVLGCDLRDIEPHDGSYETLHIAFGWSDNFPEQVTDYAAHHRADRVVVHSTVPVGTCDAHGWTHSPVRGRHPQLFDSIRTFRKHFGGPEALDAAKAFHEIGVPIEVHSKAATTEAGKLWELASLAVEVRLQKEIFAYCHEHGLPTHSVYRRFAESYNSGYEELGEFEFVKPILEHMPGPLGGHCVAQNAPMLDNAFVDQILRPISPDTWDGDRLS